MRYIFFITVLFLTGFGALGQNMTLIDSLRKQLSKATGVQQFVLMNTIGFEYRYSYPDSTIFYCTQSFELGRRLQVNAELSKPLSFIGLAYAYKGDYKKSLDYHNQAIEVAAQQQDTVQLAFGYNNLGRMFFDQGDMVRATKYLVQSKDIFEHLNDKSGLAYVYRSLANVYKSQDEYSKALEMSTRAYELRKQVGDARMIISALLELGLIQQSMKNQELALNSFSKADSIATLVNDKVTIAELKTGMAEILLEQGKAGESYRYAQEVQQAVTEETNQKLYLRSALVIAKYYFQQNQFSQAIPLLEKILKEAEQTGNPSFQRDACYVLTNLYQKMNDPIRAGQYDSKYRILTEMLKNADLTRQIDRLQFQLEIEKKEHENEQLKSREARSAAIIAKQRFQNILLVIVISFVSVVAFIAWYSARKRRLINRQLRLQNQHIVMQQEEIVDQNEKLSRRNHELSDINHEKDTLMSIVAHDLKSPLNRIYGLTRLLEMEGKPEQQREYINLMKTSTQAGLDLITDLLDVNALEEHKGGVKATQFQIQPLLQECLDAIQMTAERKLITLHTNNAVIKPVITDADYLNRILDNLLSNAVKFSPKGSSVTVSVREVNGILELSVKDQGPGFSAADKTLMYQKFKKLSARPTAGESSNGLGLAIVKTLIDRLSGSIELISEAGKGSEFIVKIPLKAAPDAST